MSLSDLPNPKAAAALIEQFRKRFSAKVCMAPHPDHEGPVISAHTLSVEAMLRKIAVDSHVYVAAQAKRLARDTFPIEVQRKGLRDVTVFNGFCQKHDRDLFACLELEALCRLVWNATSSFDDCRSGERVCRQVLQA